MAEAFTPRFVDLVRNTTHTQGTDNFVLGAALSGYRSFAEAVLPGESFYYSCIGVDKPSEREIGRGTMEIDGTISRIATNGELTSFTAGTKTIALVAAAEWFNSVQSAGGAGIEINAASHGIVADGATDNRAAFAAADSAAASGKALSVPPGIFAVASDLTFSALVKLPRGARIKPAAGVNIHFSEGYVADDWNWCFDISAAGSSVTGDKAPNGHVTPQHFGADPTDRTIDDMPAIEAATEYAALQPIRDEYAIGFPVKFPHPGSGNYYLTKSRPIYIARTTHWFGETRIYLRDYGGVEIRAADGLDAVAFAFFPGGSSAADEYETVPDPGAAIPGIGKPFGALRSRFSDLSFLPEPGASVRQGFVHNAVCFLDRCVASGFTEANFHAHAQTSGSIINAFAAPGISNNGNTSGTVPASTTAYDGTGAVFGNVNGSVYRDCYAPNAVAAANGGAHGFVAHGNNAGTVKYIGCDANGNQGAGFLENSSIGCELFGCHSAQNCWDVEHGGARYICIKGHMAASDNEPGVGANWRTYWYQNTSTIGDAAWAPGQYYHPSGGVNVSVANSRTSIIAHYSEGGIEVGVIARNHTEVRGGNACERTCWHGEFAGAKVSPTGGVTNSPYGYVGQTVPGDGSTDYGINLGQTSAFTGGRILSFGDGRDDSLNKCSAVRLGWNNIRGRYEFTDASNSSRPIFGMSGNGYSGSGYGGVTQSYLWANGMYLGDGSVTGINVSRLRTATNLAAITDATYGAAARGDVWLYTQPSPGGAIGARCTAAGTIGSTAAIEEIYPSPVKIAVGTSAPPNPSPNDLWVDTN